MQFLVNGPCESDWGNPISSQKTFNYAYMEICSPLAIEKVISHFHSATSTNLVTQVCRPLASQPHMRSKCSALQISSDIYISLWTSAIPPLRETERQTQGKTKCAYDQARVSEGVVQPNSAVASESIVLELRGSRRFVPCMCRAVRRR